LTAAVASSVGFSFALDGLIDEVRISSQALPESELLINLAQPIPALSIPALPGLGVALLLTALAARVRRNEAELAQTLRDGVRDERVARR